MVYRVIADLLLGAHLLFVLFVVFGGLLVCKWKRWAWIHIPAVLWAAFVEFSGWVCPLTPLENWFRRHGGGMGYRSGFLEYYILPLLYPTRLTHRLQIILGLGVVGVNLALYAWIVRRAAKREA